MLPMRMVMKVDFSDGPIAVFDSGVGGLSVLRELVRQMPMEKFLYFGDSVNAPYGSRPAEEIRALTIHHAERLFDEGAKALVIACNTATSIAVQELRQMYPERIIIGIEPALKPAIEQFPNGRIVVMATETTLRERKFAELLTQYAEACQIIKCPCPGLVELVERGELSGETAYDTVERYLDGCLSPLPDAIVLGCTHFPFLKDAIRQVVGEKPLILDGADGTAKETRRRIEQAGLLRNGIGSVTLTNSLQTQEMIALSETLLNA